MADTKCPSCGTVMCQQFDEAPVTALASVAIPNGDYKCYRCGHFQPRPTTPPEAAAPGGLETFSVEFDDYNDCAVMRSTRDGRTVDPDGYQWVRLGDVAALRPSPPAPAPREAAIQAQQSPVSATSAQESPAPAEPPASADWRDFKADPPKPGPENRVLFRGISRGRSFAGYAYVDGWVGRMDGPYHNYSYRLTITHWRPLP